jgi:NADH-quinone oxidoreductase subunit H
MNTITMSAVVVTLFFGGPDGPIPHFIPTSTVWMPVIWFVIKTVAFCFIYVWFRAALPRLRYDQLMDLGWKRLIPMTLAWLLLVASVLTWHWWGGLIMVAVIGLAAVLLTRANKLGSDRSEEDAILPTVGQHLTPAPRLSPVPDKGAPEGDGA